MVEYKGNLSKSLVRQRFQILFCFSFIILSLGWKIECYNFSPLCKRESNSLYCALGTAGLMFLAFVNLRITTEQRNRGKSKNQEYGSCLIHTGFVFPGNLHQ